MKKILFVTERRADYSRFRPVLQKIKEDDELDYRLIVTGAWLLDKVGHPRDIITKDGFKITAEVKMFDENYGDKGNDMARAFGNSVIGLTEEVKKITPDLIMAGFDLSANLAIAIIGGFMNIPVAHLQGGEVTGTIDESLRHAITKFSQIHFCSNDDARQRIIKMGEKRENVFAVGSPSLDLIKEIKLISRRELEKEFDIDFSKPFIIVLQHPVTTEINKVDKQMMITLQAIEELDVQTILIYPNTDAGSQQIIKKIEKSKIKQVKSLPFEKFISLLKLSRALVGNSSAGIHETATLKIPAVNIGSRQNGRLRPSNVIDVGHNKKDIKKAIRKALYPPPKLWKSLKNCYNPYGDGNSAKKIIKILKTIDFGPHMVQKKITY